MKNIFFICIILLSVFKIFLFNCIQNQNCLTERGECIDNQCVCYEEFWTLKSNNENKLPNMFCNYEKRSRFIPLILEFFLPGVGHIVMKKYILASIKIGLLLIIFIYFYIGFINHKSEKIEENNNRILPTNILKEDEQKLLINKNQSSKVLNNPLNEDNYNVSEISEDLDSNYADNEGLHVANHEEVPISISKKCLNFIGFISLISFFVIYLFDLIAYGLGFYKDSNNVPFL